MNRLMISSIVTLRMTLCNGSGLSFHCLFTTLINLLKIEGEWEHDYLFTQQSYYTLLFDDEDDLELVGDTALTSVQVEWILLENRMVKKYYFERTKGVWMLEAINLRQIEQGRMKTSLRFICVL